MFRNNSVQDRNPCYFWYGQSVKWIDGNSSKSGWLYPLRFSFEDPELFGEFKWYLIDHGPTADEPFSVPNTETLNNQRKIYLVLEKPIILFNTVLRQAPKVSYLLSCKDVMLYFLSDSANQLLWPLSSSSNQASLYFCLESHGAVILSPICTAAILPKGRTLKFSYVVTRELNGSQRRWLCSLSKNRDSRAIWNAVHIYWIRNIWKQWGAFFKQRGTLE